MEVKLYGYSVACQTKEAASAGERQGHQFMMSVAPSFATRFRRDDSKILAHLQKCWLA